MAAGLGLPSAGDRQESIDASGIACLDGEEKIEGRSGRSITLGNGNLEEPREQHLELDVEVDVALVGDREKIKVKEENGYGELGTENGDDCDWTADATLNIDVSEANGWLNWNYLEQWLGKELVMQLSNSWKMRC